ncbi:P-loop containing nucleoside triphosphate hydrolase protein [Sporormia fimetaria CBS 119925]|uniref:ATP-dependent DNA helicase n=1 Tax=Sporormia fimetaria CBS 119925 TaxID=1340428 RepID=A0A6A6VJ21_9PLEO|nr:P-loop containing nucleoside triphosphate hydrolase protein [Sporormia fimetaria CBS 119925]
MDDSDDYGDLDDTEFLEAATQAEQTAFPPSARPGKRRKIAQEHPSSPPSYLHRPGPFAESSDDDYDDGDWEQPSPNSAIRYHDENPRSKKTTPNGDKNGTPREPDGLSRYAQKKKERIHMPTTTRDLADVIYTQPPRENSPPWKMRGAIFQKSALTIGVHRPSAPAPPAPPPPKRASLESPHRTTPTGLLGVSSTPVLPRSQHVPSPALRGAVGYDPRQELADLPSDAFTSDPSSPQKLDNENFSFISERRAGVTAQQTNLRQTTLFGTTATTTGLSSSQTNQRYNFVSAQNEEPPTHHKLDLEAMKTWVYPTNIGVIRDYQFNIVAKGLYHNLLVALPTGLGKTFIAATVMLNWFRWTVDAQIVFVAPTRPLVAQQVEACFNIAGIPRSQTTMLIGGVAPGLRAEEWINKRVFFMTPQTLLNDLKSGIADPKKIVLLVVDEAHKATGSYAYVEVVSLIKRFNPSFRVLALTATPGSDVKSVQKVIDGLQISRIEIRTEKSFDIRQYIHQRSVEKKVFKNSEEMEMCMELYSAALMPAVKKLAGMNAFWSSNPIDLTPYGCTQASRKWMMEQGRNANQGQKSMVMMLCSILGSISQGMELLKYHSISPFYLKMKEFRDDTAKSKSKYKEEICNSEAFQKLMNRLDGWVSNEEFIGHPKLEYLQQVILEHFLDAGDGQLAEGAPPSQTRVMVFAHFRDSAEEIVRVLKRHEPMIRPRVFVGQAGSKNSEGMAQKDQLAAVEKFKNGTFNTLVATSIGEEGLDIGEVDLIVCYDSKASPLRMLQRMGRTGRKRQGRIVLLQMQGKEEQDFIKAKDSYEKMQELIANGTSFSFHEETSRRIVPPGIHPVVDQRVVEIPLENSQTDFLPEPRKKGRAPKKPPKKFHTPDGVIMGFVTANRMDQQIKPKSKAKAKPVPHSEELYVVPTLETVMLDETASQDLERRYQTVFDDDEAPVIEPLLLGRFPDRQRMLSASQLFQGPGRVRRRFVETLQRMHNMDKRSEEELQMRTHVYLDELESETHVVVSDADNPAVPIVIEEDMWASDDPASQPGPKSKTTVPTKSGPAPKSKTTVRPEFAVPSKPIRKAQNKATAPLAPKPIITPVRPRVTAPSAKASVRKPRAARGSKTSVYGMAEAVEEGASSSPPPTDPRYRLATQGVDLGSQDTESDGEHNDTLAYLDDSELRSFIAADEEDVDIPDDSSLPDLDSGGLGRGTQAIVKQSRAKRPERVQKLFTSDITEDDMVVSSDKDDGMPTLPGVNTRQTWAASSDSEAGVKAAVPARRRACRVVTDDEDED